MEGIEIDIKNNPRNLPVYTRFPTTDLEDCLPDEGFECLIRQDGIVPEKAKPIVNVCSMQCGRIFMNVGSVIIQLTSSIKFGHSGKVVYYYKICELLDKDIGYEYTNLVINLKSYYCVVKNKVKGDAKDSSPIKKRDTLTHDDIFLRLSKHFKIGVTKDDVVNSLKSSEPF